MAAKSVPVANPPGGQDGCANPMAVLVCEENQWNCESMTRYDRKTSGERTEELAKLLSVKEGEDYTAVAARLRTARALFHEIAAEIIESPLNAQLANMPQNSLEEKRELAKWVNHELRVVGLSIRCPKTGKPAFLRGDQGYDSQKGRWQLCLSDDSNSRHVNSSGALFHLDIMSSPDRYLQGDEEDSWMKKVVSADGKPIKR